MVVNGEHTLKMVDCCVCLFCNRFILLMSHTMVFFFLLAFPTHQLEVIKGRIAEWETRVNETSKVVENQTGDLLDQ